MDFRYFYFPNGMRPYRLGGKLITTIRVAQVGSVWDGIFRTRDPDILKDLEQWASAKKFGVMEITEERYDELKKKGWETSQSDRVRLIPEPSFAGPQDRRGVVVPHAAVADAPNQPAPTPEVQPQSAKTAAELVQTDQVSSGDSDSSSPAPKRRAKRKPGVTAE